MNPELLDALSAGDVNRAIRIVWIERFSGDDWRMKRARAEFEDRVMLQVLTRQEEGLPITGDWLQWVIDDAIEDVEQYIDSL